MTSPVPGFTYPTPRTWAKGDIISTPRLRGDMTNLADLFAGGARPMLLSVNLNGTTFLNNGSITPIPLGGLIPLNTWNVTVIGTSAPVFLYAIPLAGWYLVQADLTISMFGLTTPFNNKYATGFSAVIDGAASANTDGGAVPAGTNTTVANAGGAACELYQFNASSNSSNSVGLYGFTNNAGGPQVVMAALSVEWVGLPTTTLTNYTGPQGTVVSSPQAVVPFPPGPGTTLTASVSAGATSITVASNTGMIVGGTLGLDYTQGMLAQPIAEAVNITSVSGTTIGISAAAYTHGNFLTGQLTSFEGGIGTWINDGNTTVTGTSAQAHTGLNSLLLTSQGIGQIAATLCPGGVPGSPALPCSPGDSIFASGWFRADTTGRNCTMTVRFETAAGGFISYLGGAAVADSNAGWVQATATLVAPATAAWAKVDVVVAATGGIGEKHYADDVVFNNTTTSPVPVAVPVSAAFLNQQCRDVIDFLSYPPMLRVQTTAVQSIPSQVFPAGTQIVNLTRLGTGNLDNYSGFTPSVYTVQIAGVYFVYGQVYYAGSTSVFNASAGLQVDAGTIQWGTMFRCGTSGGAQTMCATVRRHLRLNAGQTIKLYGTQDVGAAMNTEAAGATFSKLIAVWRAE